MVNWIHQIDPDALRTALRSYLGSHLAAGGVMVLDTVDDPAYMHNHDVYALAPSAARVELIGDYPRGRRVWVVR